MSKYKNLSFEQLREKRVELNDKIAELYTKAANRKLNAEEEMEDINLNRELSQIEEAMKFANRENEHASHMREMEQETANKKLREFLLNAPKGKSFSIPVMRSSISYGEQSGVYAGTADYIQGITVVDLIDTQRKDNDILATAGVPMTVGVRGNKIQWAYAGGVEAAFANELAATTERTIDLDKQVPVQQRLTVRVRISNQALENTDFDLQGYIVEHVAQSIHDKINWAAASTTKATSIFYGGFAQDTESGTYGNSNYVAGKQAGTYSSFTKDTAAEMIGKLAVRNLPLDNVCFVMGAEDFWTLKVTPKDSGSGIMLIGDDNTLLGIPVVVNNAINRSTQTGAVSGHNIGLGNFKYLPVMQHGNIRLSVDANSATASSTDEVITTINADFSMTVLKDGADAFVLYAKSE